MRVYILLGIGITLLTSSFLLYPESVKIMSGDYMFSKWAITVETNKNFALLFFLIFAGGCIGYIVYKLYKRYWIIKN